MTNPAPEGGGITEATRMALLTREAEEAIEWVRVRLPHAAFKSFCEEMEAAIDEIGQRYGVDDSVREGFRVTNLVSKKR